MFGKIINNQKGFILITAYMVVAVLLILSSAYLMYALTQHRSAQRERWSQQAFYAAEEGVALAIAESRQADYQWYTHTNSPPTGVGDAVNTAVQSRLGLEPPPTFNGTYTRSDGTLETGLYRIPGGNFLVKTYRDPVFSGVTVIRSVGRVNNVQRAIENRISGDSMFRYFMFFAQSRDFGYPRKTLYDAHKLGGIHVNGNIYLYGPEFKDVTGLACSGYFKTPHSEAPYPDPADYDKRYWDNTTKSYKNYASTDPRYNDGKAEWPREIYPWYSDYTEYGYTKRDYGDSPFWNIDNYFQVGDAFDDNRDVRAKINHLEIPITLGDGSEGTFDDAYYDWQMYAGGSNTVTFDITADDDESGVPDVFEALNVANAEELYNQMQEHRWTENTNAKDWLNAEFEYGRGLNTFDASKYVKVNYLDTEQPGQLEYWTDFLADPDETKDTLTGIVQDYNAGIRDIEPSTISTQKKEDAKNGGVYIRDYDLDFDDWNDNFEESGIPQTSLINPISACSEVKWFYNSVRPPTKDGVPKRTRVLEIDVKLLTGWIATNKPDFNGILYVDLRDTETYDGANADYSVMLVNAKKLPVGGLTVVSPSSVYVKGDYNTASSQEWEPSAIFTNSLIYTLSKNFNYPGDGESGEDLDYMPMPYDYIKHPSSVYYDDFLKEYITDLASRRAQWQADYEAEIYDTAPPAADSGTNALGDWIKAHLTGSEITVINSAGEDEYDLQHDRTSGANIMANTAHQTTYNVAMITPYDPEGYMLERWGWYDEDGKWKTKKRKIQGAFLQLASSEKNNGYAPAIYSHGDVISDGTYTFSYEPNFGQADPTLPPGGSLGGLPPSWTEIDPGQF